MEPEPVAVWRSRAAHQHNEVQAVRRWIGMRSHAARDAVERLLKVPEVAELLGCSPSFVYNSIADGSLKHYRLGKGQGGIRVSQEQIDEYLQSAERGGTKAKVLHAPTATPNRPAPSAKD